VAGREVWQAGRARREKRQRRKEEAETKTPSLVAFIVSRREKTRGGKKKGIGLWEHSNLRRVSRLKPGGGKKKTLPKTREKRSFKKVEKKSKALF